MKISQMSTAVVMALSLRCVASVAFAADDLAPHQYPATQKSVGHGKEEPTGAAPVAHVPDEIIVKFRSSLAHAIERQLQLNIPAPKLALSQDLDELNAGYRLRQIKPIVNNFRTRHQRLQALRHRDQKLLSVREQRLVRRLRRAPKKAKVPDLGRMYKIQVDLAPGQSLQDLLAAYNSNSDVEYAELNYIVTPFRIPNDPRYSTPGMWALAKIDAPKAWDVNTGSSDIVIAVIDTGVDYAHRDMVDNMWVNEIELGGAAGVDDDENGYIDDIYGYDFENQDSDPIDDNGHGTHCAGTIAGVGNNGLDVTGVCWNAKIMGIKFLGADGGTIADAASSFYYAVQNGADVTSNSWGGSSISQTEREAIEYAYSQGVITVAAAGNDNSSVPDYPAAHENVIAVAATGSHDEKASFSNYGDWVDIAAPGVDILSLRADGTSLGLPYDTYTTTAEGTSMACPHVAGACALLLSHDPTLTCDQVYDILIETADPIPPGICLSNGRLNLFAAIVAQSRGKITLDHDYYPCAGLVSVSLSDPDLEGDGTKQVTLTTSGGDFETLLLTETVPTLGVFTGTISTTTDVVNIFDGLLQVAHNHTFAVIYYDDDDGTGRPAVVMDSAIIDCEPPVILSVEVETGGTAARVTFETDEPTIGQVRCGLACGGPYTSVSDGPELTSSHSIQLTGLSEETIYYFVVDATDGAGHQTTDDNGGACYSFSTGTGRILRVPSVFPTIQAAINEAWDLGGDTVLVADGTYKGAGNRDIDFTGKPVTVRSENGPQHCIIDCEGTEANPHSGFYFDDGEGESSVLDGFTITNGHTSTYDTGGAIKCIASSPAIRDCLITNNWAGRGGGIYNGDNSSPTVTNCTFNGNSSWSDGGGMYNGDGSSPTLTDCNFTGNSSTDWSGGAIRNTNDSSPNLTNCTFSGNFSNNDGGGMDSENNCHPTLTNCTFSDNTAGNTGGAIRNNVNCNATLTYCTFNANTSYSDGGAIFNYSSSPTLTNCMFFANSSTGWSGGAIRNTDDSSPKLSNCIFSGNSANYSGGGMHNSIRCHATVTNCTFSGNSANDGGAVHNYESDPIITNCIFWGNHAITAGNEIYNNNSNPTVTYCDVQAGYAGEGNIDADPLFVDAAGGDYHLSPGSPAVDAGDPASDYTKEPWPNGGRVNMGAYGNTKEATRSSADFDDLAQLCDNWLEYDPVLDIAPEPAGDGIINFLDFALFADWWLLE